MIRATIFQPSSSPVTIVVKIGGSLLDWPELPSRLKRLLDQRSDVRPVLIGGGGAAADVVRSWGDTFSLSETVCHELALQAMGLTASLLTQIVPQSRIVSSIEEAAECWSRGERPVLSFGPSAVGSPHAASPPLPNPLPRSGGEGTKGKALREDCGLELPQSWAVTSDSLAAWVAWKWRADELWLLKSTDLPAGISFAEASRHGLVDEFFPRMARRIPSISWCNLRSENPRWNPFHEADGRQLGGAAGMR